MRSKSRFTSLVLLETRDLCAIALYASRPLSPGATQHLLPSVGRLPLTRTGLPPAGSHQLAWRTHSSRGRPKDKSPPVSRNGKPDQKHSPGGVEENCS